MPPPEPSPYVAARDELALSGAALAELMQGVLARPARFSFRASGFSMLPFVRDGDELCIAPLGRGPGLGDVVAFMNPETARPVVHRIIAQSGSAYHLAGDNVRGAPEGPVTRSDLLGRVTGIRRNGRDVRLGLGPERYAIALLSRLGWLPRLTAGLSRVKQWILPGVP